MKMKGICCCCCYVIVVVVVMVIATDARHVRRRAASVRRHVEDAQIDVDVMTPDVTSHRRHHHRKVAHYQNITRQDLKHSVEARSQVEFNYAQQCREGEIEDGTSARWTSPDRCKTCQCQANDLDCHETNCPDLPCDDPVHVEGECCPMCPEKLCQANDGRYFKDGGEWHLDDCTFCECSKGKVLCSVEDCEWKACSSPVKVPGKCCPICPDTSCLDVSGTNQTAGAVWKEGVCTHCYCRKGDTVCADEECPHINCTNPFRSTDTCCYKCQDAVECVVSSWGDWGECPIQPCGSGMRRRYRHVVVAPRNGGAFCPHMSEAQMCPRLPCNSIPVCPVTDWSSWSHCTHTCGNGFKLRTRTRATVTKATMTSLIDCTHTHMQEKVACYTGTCLAWRGVNDDVDISRGLRCENVTWSDWSSCSNLCGVGVRTRAQLIVGSTEHNLTCHLLSETKKCHGHDCSGSSDQPIHCKVTHWSPWSPCSATCGAHAARSKHRTVVRHPSANGRKCPSLISTSPCKLTRCRQPRVSNLSSPDACVSADGRTHYAENEQWSPVECMSCVCVRGRKSCQQEYCAKLDCPKPIKVPGLCCAFCDI